MVSNTDPWIALGGIGHIDVLERMFGTVHVPGAVVREVEAGGVSRPGAADLARVTWINRVEFDASPDALLLREVGAGEAEAIVLARQLGARLLLMDDRRGRRVAELAYGLTVKGSAGLLVMARRAGLVAAVRPLFMAMRGNGYYLGNRLVERACAEMGE